jgi:hypothetical protein
VRLIDGEKKREGETPGAGETVEGFIENAKTDCTLQQAGLAGGTVSVGGKKLEREQLVVACADESTNEASLLPKHSNTW